MAHSKPLIRLQTGRARSRIACTRCRQRKVRCDVFMRGNSCTNCSLDGIDCNLPENALKLAFKGPDTPLTSQPPCSRLRLPNFIQQAPDHLTKMDMEYIRAKKAAKLPRARRCQALIHAYKRHFHPLFPILADEQIPQYDRYDAKPMNYSLILFQSLLFTGQVQLEKQEHRCSKASDAQSLFRGSRLLYEIGWETDQLILLQAILLMSLFPSDPGEIKDSGYLVAEAISLAYRLGLNYDPVSMTTNTREIGLRKRLWWAVYIRDKEVSLEADRPKTIGRDDFDVPDLLQSDFDLNAPCPRHHDGCPAQECASNERKKTAIQFMHRAKRAQDPEGVDYAPKVRYWKFDPWATGDLEVTGGLIPELGG